MNQWNRIIITLNNLLVIVLLASIAQAEDVQRTSYLVSNFSCSSCLENIEAELKSLSGTIGMNADMQRGRITVDHKLDLSYEKIASVITNIGFPVKVDWTATMPEQNVTRYSQLSKFSPKCSGSSRGNCGVSSSATRSGPCNATSTTWKKLYNRFFAKTNSK
jgi:copper chaperone CopZ